MARQWGVTGDEALIASGLAKAVDVYRALADATGLPFQEGGFTIHPSARPTEAIQCGLAPLAPAGDGPGFAYAPRGRDFVDLLTRPLGPGARLLITTPHALGAAVFRARGQTIAREAAERLARERPEESFHGSVTRGQVLAALLLALLATVSALAADGAAWLAAITLFSLPFLGLAGIKLSCCLERPPMTMPPGLPRDDDRDLPVYTVLVPLYRERRIVGQLLTALRALDYPAAKLDAKILVEEGDVETASVLAAHDLPGFVEIVTVPPGLPRTKPRALNVGLPLARGRYLVIYDAEDVPDPGQLRAAVAVFARSEPDVVCLQARLVIDNTADGILARFFTVEYGALFDVVNPALPRLDFPIPLGGTSNHFKTDVLRSLGGWDPWNVTEDADLAMRIATAGYRVADLPSSTLEEAPARLRAWMGQRTRWMKGFVQVAITHSRRPMRNLEQLGAAKLLGATALILGAVASALVYPILTVLILRAFANGSLFSSSGLVGLIGTAAGTTLLAAGLLAMTVPGFLGIARRGWWSLWPYAALMPLYYLLVSVAAWRGVLELVTDPDRWNKTEHGLARSSRAGAIRPADRGAAGVTAAAAVPRPRVPALARG